MTRNDDPIANLKRKYASAFDGPAMRSLADRCADCRFDENVRDDYLKRYKRALSGVLSATEDSDEVKEAHLDLVNLGVDVTVQEALSKPRHAAAGAQGKSAVTMNDAPSSSTAAQMTDQGPPPTSSGGPAPPVPALKSADETTGKTPEISAEELNRVERQRKFENVPAVSPKTGRKHGRKQSFRSFEVLKVRT